MNRDVGHRQVSKGMLCEGGRRLGRVLGLLLVFLPAMAEAQAPGPTPEEVFAAELRQQLGVRPGEEAAFAAYLAQLTPLFVLPAGQPRPGVEQALLFFESGGRLPGPPTAFAGEAVWSLEGTGPEAMLSVRVVFPSGSSITAWIARAAAAPAALEFGLREISELGAMFESLFEVSIGGRYLIERTPLAREGVLAGPGTLVANIAGAALAEAAPALRVGEVLSFVVLVGGGSSTTLSIALGETGRPLLDQFLAATGL